MTYGHLVEGWPQHKAISAARKTGFFIRAAFQPLVDFSSNKKSPRLRLRLFCWSGWRDSNSRPLAPHASALPGCATSRFGCSTWPKPNLPVVMHMGMGHLLRGCKDNQFLGAQQTAVSRL